MALRKGKAMPDGWNGKRQKTLACKGCGTDHTGIQKNQYCPACKARKKVDSVIRHRRYLTGPNEYMNLDDFEFLLARQGHVCAICKKPETRRNRKTNEVLRLSIDHDHKTGLVRGLLCFRCNRNIAVMDADGAWLYRAAQYMGQALVYSGGAVRLHRLIKKLEDSENSA
jgi:hypothetical protein